MSDYNYLAWVQEAWKLLERDFRSGDFIPQDEYDIQERLYETMFLLKHQFADNNRVFPFLEWNRRLVDLAIILSHSPGHGMPQLFLQLKKTAFKGTFAGRSREEKRDWYRDQKLRLDIDKSRELEKRYPQAECVLGLFFLKAPRQGIRNDIEKMCAELTSELKERENLVLMYGPRPES